MLIAQMTDIHIGFAPDEMPEELNRVRFRATLARLVEGPNNPDVLVLTGDITDRGDLESFRKTVEDLDEVTVPVWPMVGNHDTREALLAAVEGRRQIVAIHCGHLHRPLFTSFRGIPLAVTPSVAPLVAMDLRPISPEMPDGRELITTEPPTYALHRWEDGQLATHYERITNWNVLAHYSESLQPMIKHMFSERGVG